MFFTVFIIVFCTSLKHVKGKRNDSGKELYSTSTQLNDEDSQEHLNRPQNLILKDLINNMVLVAGGSFMKNMVNIEGGSFAMGCEKNYCDIDEKPLHNVKLRSFQMSKYIYSFFFVHRKTMPCPLLPLISGALSGQKCLLL